MTLETPIFAGTITLVLDSATVIGVGTNWFLTVSEGDDFRDVDSGFVSTVSEVVSDTELVLVDPWKGGVGSGRDYKVIPRGRLTGIAENTTKLRGIIQRLEDELPFKQVTLTQAEYDLLTPDASTLYYITA